MEVEVENTGLAFRFRLVDETGASEWASYKQVAYRNGLCAATEYYLPADKACKPISCEELVKAFAVR